MAENVAITPGTGDAVAADDIGSVKFQRIKLVHGADGTNDGDVSSANGLPVNATGQGDVPITLDGEEVTANLGATDNAVLDDIAANQTDKSQHTKITDGTEEANVNASNELQTRDDDANTLLGTIDGDTSDIATDTGNIATDASTIAGDTSDIATDTGNIATDASTIAGDTASLDDKVTACNTGAVVLTNDSLVGAGDPTIDSYTSDDVNLAANTADQAIIAAPGANKQIWIYGLVGTADVAGTISIQDEDDTALSGVMPVSETGGFVMNPSGNFSMPWIKAATNKAVEIDTVTCTFDGVVVYAIVSV